MSNGVEVLVKDKNSDTGKVDQRKLKLMHHSSPIPQNISLLPNLKRSLLSSAVATVVDHRQMSALFPLHQLMQHNYIIKTCLTTYTYLTTVVHNKRSAISTFETIVSVVTTESLTNLFATDLIRDIKPTKTKFTEVKTLHPSAANEKFQENLPKIDKRIDSSEVEDINGFDLIQPSELSHTPCSTSCSCSHTKTEALKTKYYGDKLPLKATKYGVNKLEVRPTNKEALDKKTQYVPYEYESSSQAAPTDRIVEKYTEVINEFSAENESASVEESELLTNEQAPTPPKNNKIPAIKTTEKIKPDKPQKPNKNKFVVADLLKLGTLGIKGLSQLAPVLEKMTGSFIKRHDTNRTTTTSTSKPESKMTLLNANKRVDVNVDSKQSSFPIYIPVDEMETSESQLVFTNATLHQNLAWAAEHKHPKARIAPPKIVHESPLVNGGIPISPGEIINANSDVIVGKPAVGGILTLAASGINVQNPVNPPPLDSFVSGNEQYVSREKPSVNEHLLLSTKVDDSYDLRPPELPKSKNTMPIRNQQRQPPKTTYYHQATINKGPQRPLSQHSEYLMKTEQIKSSTSLGNHGRPAFLDYIPSFGKPPSDGPVKTLNAMSDQVDDIKDDHEVLDNSPSSSEVINTRVNINGEIVSNQPISEQVNKPFLVDIQPSKVANVLIPHGSSTALVFAGSSEPHKTGDYVDDPLPYPEPGYFGSFSIDAPQMTNVHNLAPHNKPNQMKTQHPLEPFKHSTVQGGPFKDSVYRNDQKYTWKDSKRPFDYNRIPPPTSNQETYSQVGPQITVYNPDIYKPNNDGGFDQYKKDIIDKEYENYLAVPPPPPPKITYSPEKQFENNKPYYSQKPIIHTKPVQDMKVFLNVQHPVPKPQNVPHPENPPTVTSEIYFAAQAPPNKYTPTYTIQIPHNQNYNQGSKPNSGGAMLPPFQSQQYPNLESNSFSVVSSPNIAHSKPVFINEINDKDNLYTVTLNTATNVAGNIGDAGQIVGSSVPVSVDVTNTNKDVPIGTNFAIRVEEGPSKYETYVGQGEQGVIISHNRNEHAQSHISVSVGDNRWNSSIPDHSIYQEYSTATPTTASGFNHYNIKVNESPDSTKNFEKNTPSTMTSFNSHANFPMVNDQTTNLKEPEIVKPVTEYIDDIKPDQRRPPKIVTNIPTNSHGWYSSVPLNDVKNIKVDSTTRKIIPLHEYSQDSKPEFGQKVASIGKPPTEFWIQGLQTTQGTVMPGAGRPFSKPTGSLNTVHDVQVQKHDVTTSDKQLEHTHVSTNKPFNLNYIPHNIGVVHQPVYDIPVRDNSDETTTQKVINYKHKKPVYEDSEEVYDGEESSDSEVDGEVSLESMKVPVVSSSLNNDKEKNDSTFTSSTQIDLLQDEILGTTKESDKKVHFEEFNSGTQTEKPFDAESYNKGSFHSNTIKPIYEKNSNMKPRPFTVNTISVLDHQLHQPHWQINQLSENSTNASYEDSLELNIGEQMSTVSTLELSSTQKIPYRNRFDNRYKNPQRPVFSVRPNKTYNDDSIITSNVHIQDKKPLTVIENKHEKSTTLPTFTITSVNFETNQSSSEIIDLSPPPPTMDYNFKPSSAKDETIMGMSPPPPRNPLPPMRQPMPTRSPVTSRPIPNRTPPPYRSKPPRTLPPRVSTQRSTRKPIKSDDISTYRPAYDILNNIKRPIYNRDQPSSQLLPPPRVITSVNEIYVSPTITPQSIPDIVFPTPISSGWLTSSGVEFSSAFDFGPTSIQFPEVISSSVSPQHPDISSTERFTEQSSERESNVSSTERDIDVSLEKPVSESNDLSSIELSTENSVELSVSTSKSSDTKDSVANESSQEDSSERVKVIPLKNRNQTRKPFIPRDDKKPNINKYKLPTRPSTLIKPTKTLIQSEILYPTKQTTTRKILRPFPTRSPAVIRPSIIESSESSIDDNYIKPTEVIKQREPSVANSEKQPSMVKTPALDSSVIENKDENLIKIKPTHHAGNEIKISDEILPTKTEFRTTVVTLTKTLSEPPKTVSSIGYVNLTHTLTVTHTKTSLISQSEGAITQTLVLTNTQTSTLVDVVTEIYTQVQPTTIIETVTKHIPVPQVEPTPVQEVVSKTKLSLDDITMSSEENENFIIRDSETTENIQKIDQEKEGNADTFFVVMNKSQNGGSAPPVSTDIETSDYDGVTRNEQVNSNGVSQVLFGEILLDETTNVINIAGVAFGKECQPDCKASRNERCQRIDGMMKCVCRPGFARMFPDRPCKPTYTYSVKLALSSQGPDHLQYHFNLADNSTKQYHTLAQATHEGINRMIMQSDLRDVYHGVHITGFQPVEMSKDDGENYQGVMNDFYVQLSDNAHESRLKEVIEKYLRNNNYSLGGTDVYAAGELMDRIDVSDFDECVSGQFHDCSEHAQCFNLRGTYTCSCLEGFADLSVNPLYPGRICSAEPVGCERCNYHGACYSRDDRRVLCECFQWYAGSSCHINLKVVLISLVTVGALLTIVLVICAVIACSKRPRPPPRSIVACIQNMPGLHQGAIPSKQRADRRALINERADSGDNSSVHNASLPYMPAKKQSSSGVKKLVLSEPPAHEPPPVPAPAVMIPRARLHPPHRDSRDNASRKQSLELSSEAKLISYLESGANANNDEMMRRKHSEASSYSAQKERNKQGALVSAGFKVSTTIRPEESVGNHDRDDLSSCNKNDLEAELARFDSLRQAYSQEDISEWTDAERRIGELTLSEARSVGGTLPASTGRAASSTRLTHQEANTMAERDLGSTFLLPHVHLYKPDITSDVSEFDSL